MLSARGADRNVDIDDFTGYLMVGGLQQPRPLPIVHTSPRRASLAAGGGPGRVSKWSRQPVPGPYHSRTGVGGQGRGFGLMLRIPDRCASAMHHPSHSAVAGRRCICAGSGASEALLGPAEPLEALAYNALGG